MLAAFVAAPMMVPAHAQTPPTKPPTQTTPAPKPPAPQTARGQAAPPPARGPMTVDPKSLYKRLGGYDGIAAIVDSFPPHLFAVDPKIPPMFTGLADTSKMRNRQLIVDQICMLAGGPCLYIGRTMEASHQGLNIDNDMWVKQLAAWGQACDDVKVKDPERKEFIALIDKLKDGIVQKPAPAKK
jgi:hemoglobin